LISLLVIAMIVNRRDLTFTNYQRLRTHHLDPVSTQRLRLDVTATNGGPSVQIDEVRCYAASGAER
jgi:hypothetical protein